MKLFYKVVSDFMDTKFWEYLSGKVLSKITLRLWEYPTFKLDPDLFEMHKAISNWCANNTGIIAFSCCDKATITGKMIRLITGGSFSHSGLILNNSSFILMNALHIEANGVSYEHAMNVFSKIDDVRIIGFKTSLEDEARAKELAFEIIKNKEKFTYDFQQEMDGCPNRLYCSELVHYVVNKFSTIKMSTIGDRLVCSPDDVASSGELIFERIR